MSFRELIFFLLGTGLGSGITLFLRKLNLEPGKGSDPVPAPRPQVESDAPPLLAKSSIAGTPLSPAEEVLSKEHVELDLSPTRIKIKGSIRGILAVASIVILGLLGWIAVRAYNSKDTDKTANPSTPGTLTPEELFSQMQRGINNPRYSLQPYPGNEVVSGLIGRYYYVDFKRADSQKTLFFGPEEYIENEFAVDFRESMETFQADVLQQIEQNNGSYRVFVRGSADKAGDDAPVLADLIEGASKPISYLPTMPGNPNQYSPHEEVQVVPKSYANRHLPNLRAAYVQEKLKALGFKATILQGLVTDRENEEDRYATMLLYVNWPQELLKTHPCSAALQSCSVEQDCNA